MAASDIVPTAKKTACVRRGVHRCHSAFGPIAAYLKCAFISDAELEILIT